jgi:precorrin-2 dehydrogenase / sirohydrochlorin ferrochelatase
MIGVALDPTELPIAVAGRGALATRRFAALREAGAANAVLFADRLPTRAELAAVRALWIAGLPDDEAAGLAALARAERVLVNVEDRPALCDFHNVAEVRRGELLLTVSTGGASPGLAARIRARLAEEFGPEWADRTARIRRLRDAWRREQRAPAEVSELTDAVLRANGWLA